MNTRPDVRPALATTLLLTVLAVAYQLALRQPGPTQAAVAGPPALLVAPARPDTLGAASTPAPVAEPEAAEPPCPPQPIRFVGTRPEPVPHRYQGTVGGEPATAELWWTRLDSVRGSFYQWQRGPEYQLTHYGTRRPPFVFTLGHEYPDSRHKDGTWRLTGLPGPVLRGVWTDPAGRQQHFVLRESYAGGVRYEIQTLLLTGGEPHSGGIAGYTCAVPSFSCQYLCPVLPPGSSPALRRLRAPPLAMRRRQMRAAYAQAGESISSVAVRLNDFGLLSYATNDYEMPFGGRPGDETRGTLLDLRTGRPLVLASQLVANHRPALRQLVAHHLLHDANFDFVNKDHETQWQWEEPNDPAPPGDTTYSISLWKQRELAPLTNEAVLTAEGLELTYWMGALSDAGSVMPDQTVLVPYAELRPLVRPGTPLARMLRARGLW